MQLLKTFTTKDLLPSAQLILSKWYESKYLSVQKNIFSNTTDSDNNG